MSKKKFFTIILALSFLTAISCGRKGTGCPTFSKVIVEQSANNPS